MKKNKSQTDFYYNEAKESGYFARSIFKLKEIDIKYKIISKKKHPISVLDLGASPGSWLQYLDTKLNTNDIIIANDINDIKFTKPRINFIKKSVFDLTLEEILTFSKSNLDLLISDMAPKTCGIKIKDQADSLELAFKALDLAIKLLKKDAHFVCKFFQIISPDVKNFTSEVKKHFRQIYVFKPKSSTKNSYESFIVAKFFKSKNEAMEQ